MNNTKTLTKSSTDKWISGVLGGFARYFNIDSNLLRIGFIIFYIACAIIMPKDPNQQ